ncbi:unnamed protein product [Symbiodinium sp. CCMP2456]|nr:unnamed protein product [Symbiodinium sp. CCMP2456]
MSKLDDFLDEIVKVHMKQLDPEAIVEEEQSAPVSWSEMVGLHRSALQLQGQRKILLSWRILLLVCYIAADYLCQGPHRDVLQVLKRTPWKDCRDLVT